MSNFIYAGSLFRTQRAATAALIYDYFSATGTNCAEETRNNMMDCDAYQHSEEGAHKNAGAALRAEIDAEWPLHNEDDEEVGLAFHDALEQAREATAEEPAFFA